MSLFSIRAISRVLATETQSGITTNPTCDSNGSPSGQIVESGRGSDTRRCNSECSLRTAPTSAATTRPMTTATLKSTSMATTAVVNVTAA